MDRNEPDLSQLIAGWLKKFPSAKPIAGHILRKAESNGAIAKTFTLPFDKASHQALAALFSAKFVRQSSRGEKTKVFFEQWETETNSDNGVFLELLSRACGHDFKNRKQAKSERYAELKAALSVFFNNADGLSRLVAERELEKLELKKGRYWSRCKKWLAGSYESTLRPYFRLLGFVDEIRGEPDRIEQVVHLSRQIAGDTHWLRPGNRIWKDLANDLLSTDESLSEMTADLELRTRRARVLNLVGIAENLTSILVMAFGKFSIQNESTSWNWATEAAERKLPIWLSARHINGASLVPDNEIDQVICVENETSFLDLVHKQQDDRTMLVYTEGHANRAVIAFLRQLKNVAPTADFFHQGDLDLYGVRILDSLIKRSSIPIRPMRMDVETFHRHSQFGIALSEKEQSSLARFLNSSKSESTSCLELLQAISKTGVRIEQEVLTNTVSGEGQASNLN